MHGRKLFRLAVLAGDPIDLSDTVKNFLGLRAGAGTDRARAAQKGLLPRRSTQRKVDVRSPGVISAISRASSDRTSLPMAGPM